MRYGGFEGSYGGAGQLLILANASVMNEAPANSYPAASINETLFKNNLSGAGTVAVRNIHASGYSAYTARTGATGAEVLAWGYGNAGAVSIFAGRNYIETWSGVATGGTVTPFVFAADGDYGRTGTPGSFRFYQRYTIDQHGTHFWNGVDYDNTQVETFRISEGGDPILMKNTVPNAIDIPVGGSALYWDSSAGTPTVKILGRDANGALFSASVATAAYTKTASDVFTDADSATALNGRAAVVGGNWALADADTWGIASNKAYRSAGSDDSYVYLDNSISDVTVEADITLSSVRASAGLVLRGVDASNYIVVQLQKSGATNAINIYKNVAGTFTLISTVAGGLALNTTYNLRAGAVGNSIYVYLDGVFKLRGESSAFATATRQGLWSFIGAADDDGGSRFDNFIVTP